MLGGIGKAIGGAIGGAFGGGKEDKGGGGMVMPPRMSLNKFMLPQDMGSPARASRPAPVAGGTQGGDDPVSYYALLIREILQDTSK